MARIMFRFWLDDTKQDENELIGQVETLKQKRKFTETIRQGIELITDLRNGNLDVLFKLFPWVQAEFLQYMQVLQWGSAGKPENGTLTQERRDDNIQEQLDRIEKWLLQTGNIPITSPSSGALQPGEQRPTGGLRPVVSGGSSGPKQLNVPQVTAPIFEDDDDDLLVVKKDENAGFEAAQNFINSMLALQG